MINYKLDSHQEVMRLDDKLWDLIDELNIKGKVLVQYEFTDSDGKVLYCESDLDQYDTHMDNMLHREGITESGHIKVLGLGLWNGNYDTYLISSSGNPITVLSHNSPEDAACEVGEKFREKNPSLDVDYDLYETFVNFTEEYPFQSERHSSYIIPFHELSLFEIIW